METKVNTYLFGYQYQGSSYSLEIPAENRREAEERLKIMPWGKYDGILIAKIPAVTESWLPSFICNICNWFRNDN